MHEISIKLINLKLNRNSTKGFCFGLKFWSQLKISKTSTFSETNSRNTVLLQSKS